MKLRILIENAETGEQIYQAETKGLAGAVLNGENTQVFFVGAVSPVEGAKILDSLDDLKKDVMRKNPAISFVYSARDIFFKLGQTTEIDVEELRRQVEELA